MKKQDAKRMTDKPEPLAADAARTLERLLEVAKNNPEVAEALSFCQDFEPRGIECQAITSTTGVRVFHFGLHESLARLLPHQP